MYQQEINNKYQKIHEYRSLLNSTDYADHRQNDEQNKPMSEEIKAARINAREQINILESEIVELEAKQKEYLETIENKQL